MTVAHVATKRTRCNVSPEAGEHLLYRHHETGVGHACIVTGQGSRKGRVLISYPTTAGRYTDGTRRHGWIKPRSVPLDDLYVARGTDLDDLKEFILKHGNFSEVAFWNP